MAARELIALSMGFYKGARVPAGKKFTYTGERVPKWAAPADATKTLVTGKVVLQGDTKPVEARKAARAKAVGPEGQDLA